MTREQFLRYRDNPEPEEPPEPQEVIVCDWCGETILPTDRFYTGTDSGDIHESCIRFALIDAVTFEYTTDECAEELHMEKRRETA